MINQVIKSEGQAKRVASAIKKDLNSVLSIFESYTVEVEQCGNQFNIKVTSKCSCPILTSACVSDVMKVVDMYTTMYQHISWHIDTEEWDGKRIPSFVICVMWREEEE